jgi:hypothetical protein
LVVGAMALSLPLAPVLAQDTSMQQQGMQQQGMQGGTQSQFDRDASATGVVQGIVQQVNWQAGMVSVLSGLNRVTLHGTPSQLASLKRGDNVSLPYNSYAGILWLTTQFGPGNVIGAESTIGGVPANLGFAQTGVMVGVVDNINKAEGLVYVSGATGRARFLAHPQVIEQLVPGEYVNLSYIQVGRVPWLSSIRLYSPTGAGAAAGATGPSQAGGSSQFQPGGLSSGGSGSQQQQ